MQKFHYSVSLHISHPDIDPAQISQALALQPTHRATRKGEPKTTPKGSPRKGHWEFSHWSYSFGTKEDEDLVPFLTKLAGLLEPQRELLQRLVNEGGEIECFLGIFTDTNCDQLLPFDLLARFADLRVGLRLDLYGSKLRQAQHPPR